jgi:hypothetical protein
MLLSAYLPWSYATSFAVLMGVCGAGCLVAAASALSAVGATADRVWISLLLIGASPFVLGSLFDSRFDLWPTVLAIGALAALLHERPLVSGSLVGLGFAAKLWPGVLLPLAVVHLLRQRGSAAAAKATGAFLVVAAACFVPFAVLAPGGLGTSLRQQLDRPLQVESLGSGVLIAARHLGLIGRLTSTETNLGQVLQGPGTRIAADLSTVLEIGTVIAVWALFARRRSADRESVLVAAAAAIAAAVAFDKVLSPQYLIWLVPFVLLAGGGLGIVAGGLLLLALGLTQTWFPWHYWPLASDLDAPWSWYLLARDLSLVALAGALLLELSRGAGFAGGRAGWRAARRAAA